MDTYLDRILAHHRDQAKAETRPLDRLIEEASGCPPTRGFRRAIASSNRLAVVAEIKRRSPSKGDLHAGLDPAVMAKSYEVGGASCLSVLTDVDHFGGSVDDLRTARAACRLPVLRKDFTVSAHDVVDTRLMGADCLLLIAAAMSTCMLVDFHSLATELGLDVLVEIHDEIELESALAAKANLIGVNQRDLYTFEVDHDRAVRVGAAIPDDVVKIAESGVRGPDDARSLRAAGFDGVLVGESIVTASDPVGAVGALRV